MDAYDVCTMHKTTVQRLYACGKDRTDSLYGRPKSGFLPLCFFPLSIDGELPPALGWNRTPNISRWPNRSTCKSTTRHHLIPPHPFGQPLGSTLWWTVGEIAQMVNRWGSHLWWSLYKHYLGGGKGNPLTVKNHFLGVRIRHLAKTIHTVKKHQ